MATTIMIVESTMYLNLNDTQILVILASDPRLQNLIRVKQGFHHFHRNF